MTSAYAPAPPVILFPSPNSLQRDHLDKKAKKALQKAAGKRIKLSL